MIISNLKGGLGNQLFIYFFTYTLARRFSSKFCFDLTNYNFKLGKSLEIDKLNLDFFECNLDIVKNFRKKSFVKLQENIKQRLDLNFYKEKIIQESNFNLDNFVDQFKSNKIYYFDGYWQNISKLNVNYQSINNLFQVKKRYLNKNYENLKLEIDNNPNILCIHVRKNDYINKNNSKIYADVGLDYYNEGISYIRKKNEIKKIYIFTDDIIWSKKNLLIKDAVYISKFNLSTIEEFELMKRFRNINRFLTFN